MGKIGIEWVRNYWPSKPNLPNAQAQAKGFYDRLPGVRMFARSNNEAHDIDVEENMTGDPGSDTWYAEVVDIFYFSGHGSGDGPVFADRFHDDGQAKPLEIRWGDQDIKWVVLDACWCLATSTSSSATDRWRVAFRGLHYLLGFRTACKDEPNRGLYFADYLDAGYTVREAWQMACEETESVAMWAYIRASTATADTYNDHWIDRGSVGAKPSDSPDLLYVSRGIDYISVT